jgi:hypothetical protein
MRWAAHVAHVCDKRNAQEVLVRKPDVKRQLGKTRPRRENNINTDIIETK